jgi:hypothetical protein
MREKHEVNKMGRKKRGRKDIAVYYVAVLTRPLLTFFTYHLLRTYCFGMYQITVSVFQI